MIEHPAGGNVGDAHSTVTIADGAEHCQEGLEESPVAPCSQNDIEILNKDNMRSLHLKKAEQKKQKDMHEAKGNKITRREGNKEQRSWVRKTCVFAWGLDLPSVARVSSYRRRDLAPADQATCPPRNLRTARNTMNNGRSDVTSNMTHEGAICQELHAVPLAHVRHTMQWPRIDQRKL